MLIIDCASAITIESLRRFFG